MSRLVCDRCGAEAVWLDHSGTPVPCCPEHPTQETFRAVDEGEQARGVSKTETGEPRQGELFGGRS